MSDHKQNYLDTILNIEMKDRSGNVSSHSKLVSFLYELMREDIPVGRIEELVRNSIDDIETMYTNGWLANYAIDVANRLEASSE